jgi:hypothetical protein
MAAAIGNKYRLALDTPEIRQQAYLSFCSHLSKGKAVKSWSFKEDGYLCSWETMMKYIRENPNEFDPIHKTIADSDGYAHWEAIAESSASGQNKEANTASLQMIMRNKFGWDKKEEPQIDSSTVASMDSFIKLISEARADTKDRTKRRDESIS